MKGKHFMYLGEQIVNKYKNSILGIRTTLTLPQTSKFSAGSSLSFLRNKHTHTHAPTPTPTPTL